jgi:alkylhydroperoxidase family enzyme
MSAPRITPGRLRDVGPLIWIISRVSGRVAGTGPPNLFMTLGRHKRLALGWFHFAGRMMPGGKLPRRETEMIILRVAERRECTYELEHHRRLAPRYGFNASDELTDRDHMLLAATDELLETRNLSDDTWAALARRLSDKQRIEFLLLVGHYDMLATTINTLRVEPDH